METDQFGHMSVTNHGPEIFGIDIGHYPFLIQLILMCPLYYMVGLIPFAPWWFLFVSFPRTLADPNERLGLKILLRFLVPVMMLSHIDLYLLSWFKLYYLIENLWTDQWSLYSVWILPLPLNILAVCLVWVWNTGAQISTGTNSDSTNSTEFFNETAFTALNWLKFGGGYSLGMAEQIPSRGIENRCLANSAMLITSSFHGFAEAALFLEKSENQKSPDWYHGALFLQHLQDFIFASIAWECDLSDPLKILEEID